MGLFDQTFGETGTAASFFGGEWWLVGVFLLIIFVCFLMAYRVPADGITLFIVMGTSLIGFYNLFIINEQYVQTLLFIVFIFVGYIAYLFFSR